jgi:YVTN family beta-propeller protein
MSKNRGGHGFAAACLVLASLPLAAAEEGPVVLGFTGKSGNDAARAFDLATGQSVGGDIDLLPEGNYPYDATIKPDGSEVWMPGASGDGVIVLDTATATVAHRVDLTGKAEYPVDAIFDPCRARAYVASRDSEVVAIIDTATYSVIDTIAIPTNFLGAGKMAVSGSRDALYVVDWFDSLLVRVNLATLETTSMAIGDSLWDLVISPDESALYVTDRGTDEVLLVDPDTLTVFDSVSVGDDPWGIDITPDGSTVVVASEDDQTVTIFDTATLTPGTVFLPSDADPRDVAIAADGLLAYVPSGDVGGEDAIYVIDVAAGNIVDTIFVGESNTNVVAVRPQVAGCGIFSDGFESGNTSAWDTTLP